MKHLKEYFNHITESTITDKLIKAFMNMDVYGPGNEEHDIEKYLKSGGNEKDLFDSLEKLTKHYNKDDKYQAYSALEILVSDIQNN